MAEPISYLALVKGTPVLAADDTPLGTVEHVLRDSSLDLFDGIVVRTAHGRRFVEADSVDTITEDAVHTSVTRVDELLKPQGDAVLEADPDEYAEGLTGWFGRMFLREHWMRDRPDHDA
jgi:hypothetical protein